jgi:hypothetical protein
VWLWAALIGHSAFCILHSPFPPVWLWGRIGGRIGGALGSHWGGSGVALGWPWGAYQLATNRLWGGSDVALMSHCGGFGSPSAFFILPSAFAPAWLWALPAFLLSTFCFLLLQGGGFPRLERSLIAVRCWMLDVRCWMFRHKPRPACGCSVFCPPISRFRFQVSSLIPSPAPSLSAGRARPRAQTGRRLSPAARATPSRQSSEWHRRHQPWRCAQIEDPSPPRPYLKTSTWMDEWNLLAPVLAVDLKTSRGRCRRA